MLKVGNTNISGVYVGSTYVSTIYVGSTQVSGSGSSSSQGGSGSGSSNSGYTVSNNSDSSYNGNYLDSGNTNNGRPVYINGSRALWLYRYYAPWSGDYEYSWVLSPLSNVTENDMGNPLWDAYYPYSGSCTSSSTTPDQISYWSDGGGMDAGITVTTYGNGNSSDGNGSGSGSQSSLPNQINVVWNGAGPEMDANGTYTKQSDTQYTQDSGMGYSIEKIGVFWRICYYGGELSNNGSDTSPLGTYSYQGMFGTEFTVTA